MKDEQKIGNIFKLPTQVTKDEPNKLGELDKLDELDELFETLVDNDKVLIEKVVSTGQVMPPGEWYDQERDEWLIVLQGSGELSYEDGSRIKLTTGDYLCIPAHQKHRVEYTSNQPPCIWLTIFY